MKHTNFIPIDLTNLRANARESKVGKKAHFLWAGKLSFLFALLFCFSVSSSAQETWIGVTDDDWNKNSNWLDGSAPTGVIGGVFTINGGAAHAPTTNVPALVTATQLLVNSPLTIPVGSIFDIDGSPGDGVITTEGPTVLTVLGTLNVDNSTGDGIQIGADGSQFLNFGSVNILNSGGDGFLLTGSGSSCIGGTLAINMSGGDGIQIDDDPLNLAKFDSKEGAIISIFTSLENAIRNGENFENSGNITIDDTGMNGILNEETGTFTNDSLAIFSFMNITGTEVFNQGTFIDDDVNFEEPIINEGILRIKQGTNLNNLTNNGIVKISAPANSITGTFTNNGLVIDPNNALGSTLVDDPATMGVNERDDNITANNGVIVAPFNAECYSNTIENFLITDLSGAGLSGFAILPSTPFSMPGIPNAANLDFTTNVLTLNMVQSLMNFGFTASVPAPSLVADDCKISVSFDNISSPALACNSNVQVSLDASCMAVLTPDVVLEGDYTCYDGYTIELLAGANIGTDTLDSSYLGETVEVKVTSPLGNSCWGLVTVESKLPPVLDCRDTTILCNTSTDPAVIGGQPTAINACNTVVTFTYSDVTESFSCIAGTGTDPDTISRITRTWQGTDVNGNSSTCVQTIHVVKPQLTMANVIWPNDTILYCGDSPSTEPATTGFPTIRYNGDTVSIDQFCLFGINYQDQEFTTSCIGATKILRVWTIYDWCRSGSPPLTNAVMPDGPQLIKVSDTLGPIITDLPIITEIQISFPDLNACAATLTVPPIVVSDECSPTDSINVKVQVGNSTVNANGGVLTNIPFGPQMVIYTATDDCGNFTQDTVMVTIQDNIAPTVICKENIVVALTQSGTAQVLAQAFDNGTYDNCALDRIRVRRMDSCGVAMDTLPFATFVNFECCDVGREVMVQLQAWDTLGNTNSCMVRVQVQDKVAPVITCPPNDTVNCDTNLTDLSIFGPATVSGGSCNNISLDYEEIRSLDNCGTGTITRTWTVPNTTNSCSQVITVELVINPTFNITRVPDSIIYVNCTDGIDIENLGQDSLQVESSGCQLLAVNYSQQVFNTNGQCKEVLRRWQVIDWCQNPQANPSLPGYEEYTQIVKLIDTIAPTFTNFLDTFVVNADHTRCNARVTLPTFIATDLCGTTPTVAINGIIANSEGGNDTITNGVGGTILLDVPVGTYNMLYTAADGCNNNTTIPVVIVVRDNEGPTVFCDDLVTTLTLKADEPLDSDDRGWVTVWASDFNCKISDCNPDGIVQTLRFPSRGIGQTTPPSDTSFGWTFNCASLPTFGQTGEQVGDLWVRDGSGNWDYVRVTVDIQDNMNVCPDISLQRGMVSGTIQNEAGARVEEVTVNIGGYSMTPSVTGIDGNYQFELPMESNYTVAPEKNMEPLNGVSTFDLVLISKHILGLNKLDSPYKHIAADVNRSGTITAYDLVQLRQLILNVKTEFSNNDSWRFVDANYNFTTDNPAAESFLEVASIGNLAENVEAHFIAVKVGDVNVTAVANRGLVSTEARTNSTIAFTAEEHTFEAGTTFSADFNLADLSSVEGYQFTMNLDLNKVEIVEVEEGVAKATNFGTTMMNRGILTTSWNQGAAIAKNEERMFSVVLRAKEAGKLSEVVNITSDLTPAEAYNTNGELLNVALAFSGNTAAENEFTLYNNKPNPFKEETTISFDLPTAGNARLTIFDISGRIVKSFNKEFGAGYNEIQVDKATLKGSGIYFYQLETATNTAKKKMILID